MAGDLPSDRETQADREALTAEMTRTAFQRRVVTRASPEVVLERALAFFAERGYRTGRTGRPNQIYVIGKREGALPRVTAEILVQPNVGRRGVTLVTVSGFGPQLRQHLADFVRELRRERRAESDQ
jgi:hypothetical protein